jgi:hypothetical protein
MKRMKSSCYSVSQLTTPHKLPAEARLGKPFLAGGLS